MGLEAPQAQGDMLSQADVKDHIFIVVPTEFVPHIPTKNTKPGEQSPAIRFHLADFTTDPHNPTIYRDALWFGVITNSLRRQIGKFLASTMTQGVATNGNNPPWQLKSMLDDPGWAEFMGNWLESEAGKAFEAECNAAVAQAQTSPTVTEEPAAAPAAAAPAPRTAPPAPPAPPAVSAPPAAPRTAPPAAPAAPVAAPAATPTGAPDIEALLAAMPPEQQAAARAVLANQASAAH